MFSWWTSDCACKLRSSEVRRQFSSSCGSFIDYSWGSSLKTDGEPFLSSSSRWLAHGFDYIISWELICKSLSCWRHTSLFSILRALSGFPGLNQNICWPFWDPLFLPDTFLTLRSCAVGFHKASVFKKTLNPLAFWIYWEIIACKCQFIVFDCMKNVFTLVGQTQNNSIKSNFDVTTQKCSSIHMNHLSVNVGKLTKNMVCVCVCICIL